MLAIEICEKCKFLDIEDMPNLWCRRIHDFINGSEVSELASAGCKKMQMVVDFENLPQEEPEEEPKSEGEKDE